MPKAAKKNEAPAVENKATQQPTAKIDRFWVNNLYQKDNLRHIDKAVTPLYKGDDGKYTNAQPSEDAKPATYAVKVPYDGAPKHFVTMYADAISQKGDNGKVFSAQFASFDGKVAVDKDIPTTDKQGNTTWTVKKEHIKQDTVLKNIEKGQAWKPDKSNSKAIQDAMAKGEAVAEAAPQAEVQAGA